MNNLLIMAKQLLDVNPNASLTGSLMLKIRGIDLGREPHDIDILLKDQVPNIIFPEDFNIDTKNLASDGISARYCYNNIIIDILYSEEEPEDYNGWRLGTIDSLMRAKYRYIKQDSNSTEKHYNDLIKLGFNFPVEK